MKLNHRFALSIALLIFPIQTALCGGVINPWLNFGTTIVLGLMWLGGTILMINSQLP